MNTHVRQFISGTALALSGALLLASPARAQQEDGPPPPPGPEAGVADALREGNALLEAKRFAEALDRYEEGLSVAPDSTALLFNAGLAAQQAGELERAAERWGHLVEVDPDDWAARMWLIRTHQKLEHFELVETHRAALYALRESGRSPDLSKRRHYQRDGFVVKGWHVSAYEHFELEGDRAIKVYFLVEDGSGNSAPFHYSLGSYEGTNKALREKGTIGPDTRLFHLDGYQGWNHETWGFFAGEPPYQTVRAKIVEILEGRETPLSTLTLGQPEAEEGDDGRAEDGAKRDEGAEKTDPGGSDPEPPPDPPKERPH